MKDKALKFLKKINPVNIIKYISSHKHTFLLNMSIFFLCISFVFIILFGLLERDGVFKTKPSPAISATPAVTKPKPLDDSFYANLGALGNEPATLNFLTAKDELSKIMLRHVLEGLVRMDQNNIPVPAVALSWTTSQDGLSWEFKLRGDSVWQDGSKVVSGDFKASYDLHISTGSPYKQSLQQLIKEVQCPDESTLIYVLNKPADNFLQLLCQSQFMPVEKSFYDANSSLYGLEAGLISYNGPWYVQEWSHNERIVLARNSKYWNKDKIVLNNIVFIFTGTPVSKMNNFKSKDYDLVYMTPPEISIYNSAGITPKSYFNGYIKYLDFNKDNAYLKNPDLQKALSLSIDRNAFLNDVLKSGPKPPAGYDFNSDLVKARQYLESAKKALGNDILTKLTITTLNTDIITLTGDEKDNFSPSKSYADEIVKQWKTNLGIDVTVKSLSLSEYVDDVQKGNLMMRFNSVKVSENTPESSLYYEYTVYALNNRFNNVITGADRDLDLYYADFAASKPTSKPTAKP